MKYFVIYDLTYNEIGTILSRGDETTVGDIELPSEGSWGVAEVAELVSLPAYLNSGGEAVSIPPSPGPEYVWDWITHAWVADISTAGEAFVNQLTTATAYYLERGFFFEYDSVWEKIPCDTRNVSRIRDAAFASIQLAPLDPFDYVARVNNSLQPIDRTQAINLHLAMNAHSRAVDAETLRLKNEIEDIYVLAETDLPAALAAMSALTWQYIPVAP